MNIKEAKQLANKYEVKKLLSNGKDNTKMRKNPFHTVSLSLIQHRLNTTGKSVCPWATESCIELCIGSEGMAKVYPSIHKARNKKTVFFFKERVAFLTMLAYELKNASKRASNLKDKIHCRLNTFSDIDFIKLLRTVGFHIEQYAETLHFYDYTKGIQKALKYKWHPNYTVTYSRSEKTTDKDIKSCLEVGVNVAVVFEKSPPTQWKGYKVVDGDITDIEMTIYNGVILGLKLKGHKGKNENRGFVVHSHEYEGIEIEAN